MTAPQTFEQAQRRLRRRFLAFCLTVLRQLSEDLSRIAGGNR